MKITVKYFASIREAIGVPSQILETQATTLAALRDELIALGPDHAESLARDKLVRLALDQVMVDESAVLTEGAEVAFFPPVTGGDGWLHGWLRNQGVLMLSCLGV